MHYWTCPHDAALGYVEATETEDGEIEVNDPNNNSKDPKPPSFSESSIWAHPAGIMDNAMDTWDEQLNFEPDEEEVTEVAREVETLEVRHILFRRSGKMINQQETIKNPMNH